MSGLVDSHVNLTADAFTGEIDAVLDRGRAAGVSAFVCICARWGDLKAVRAIAGAHPDVWSTAGAHPHNAKDEPHLSARDIADRAQTARCVAIGETGLDRHYNLSDFEDQLASFRAHIGAARLTGLPIIVHTREAAAQTAQVLEEEMAKGPFRFLLHCYTSGAELARVGAQLGGFFSVNGIMTFKAAEDVREVILADMPADRIFLETDAPYLAPVPHRGRRNEPAYLPIVAETLARLKGWTVAETAERTTDAFHRLFDKVPRA